MSPSELPDRPAFQSSLVIEGQDRPPISRLAILALAAGIVSLTAAFTTILLPLSMLAVAIGVVVMWRLSRDAQVGGRWLAQLGLVLAVASVVWSIVATNGKQGYFYAEAGQNARIFLTALGSGNTYEALELLQVEIRRQLTGTDLEKYYAQRVLDNPTQDHRAFLKTPAVKLVVAAGAAADWQLARGVDVSREGKETYVTVEMVNRAAKGKPQVVWVRAIRTLGLMNEPELRESTALWNIQGLTLPQ